jgi:hypothetical protein
VKHHCGLDFFLTIGCQHRRVAPSGASNVEEAFMLKYLVALAVFGALLTAAAQAAGAPAGLPAGVVQVSPCVAGMGEHWADPQELPFGPIHGVYEGKVIFTEVMIDQKSFAQGKGWRNVLQPLPGQTIDHVDIAFNPNGHEGYPVPHYDVHAYYVAHDVHERYCPQGIPNPESP